MSQADAYRDAYNVKTKNKKSIWEASSQLADNIKVSSRIAELKAELAKKQLWTREASVDVLKAIANGEKQIKESDKIAAVKELNAMHGYNEPTKLQVTTPQPMVIVVQNDNG